MTTTGRPVPATRQRSLPQDQPSHPSMAVIPDVREDEEQAVKMQEIINLLVAGGYFRARIKGLNNFDKVVGGMSWAIEMSNVDLDVDILFHESLTIGQKIALTEKIVRVLHTMSCPHKIEPHQIQGMDCIHIFPVIQWLVKKSIETRQQMSQYLKNYANWQFDRCHRLESTNRSKELATDDKQHLKRKYRHPARHKLMDPDVRVRTTLLEYGIIDQNLSQTSDGKSDGTDKTGGGGDRSNARKDSLMDSMQTESNKISASVVGSIVGAQSDEIQKLAEEYHRMRLEREENSQERQERQLRSRVDAARKQLSAAKQNESEMIDKIQLCRQRIDIVKQRQQTFESKNTDNSDNDNEKERKKSLTVILDALKKQKSEFKQFCREEKQRLEKQIDELSNQTTDDTEDETEVDSEVRAYEEKHQKHKKQLADLNQNVSKIQRKFDDIPTRAELSQYQKRFIELYNQVAAKHNETKKFYTLYNTLDDERMYLEKELTLIGSILDNFYQAQNSNNSVKDEYLQQFEQIVENIKQNKLKVENKRLTEKAKRDVLNDSYLELIEKQRLYYKGVKDFKEECKTNEKLIAELETRKARNNRLN